MVLSITKISKSFGGLQVLDRITASIETAEILGLIGPNGAGKSTLFNLITGIYRPDSGSIQFRKHELVGLPPHEICKIGISRTFQLVKIFPSLSVLENVKVGAIFSRKKGGPKPLLSPAECLELVGLGDKVNSLICHLTFCDRRRVEVARSIAGGSELILLDEPLAGLNETETAAMTRVIAKVREVMGTAIFWVEHKVEAIFGLCDRLIVLDFGQKIAEGTPREIASNKKVIKAYLGGKSGIANA